jgi:NAD(P)-dependent dehydrogenase (short-subunit alcohol dehydrogenase family)
MSPAEWTAADVPDLSGRTAIVTGATSGVGREAARVMAHRGARTILAVRNRAKGAEVAAEILEDCAALDVPGTVDIADLDVSSLRSVRSFAEDFCAEGTPLDILVNNAGIMMVPYDTSVDGFEMHFATNHLGHFALTGLLMGPLRAADAGRVVAVASNAHRSGDIELDNLMYDEGRGFTPIGAYSRSKLANLMGAYEFDRRLRLSGDRIVSVACHPGVTATNLADHLRSTWWGRVAFPVMQFLLQDAAAGALPLLRAATDPDVQGGEYYGPARRRETTGSPELVGSSALSHDQDLAGALWERCEELTGVSYP